MGNTKFTPGPWVYAPDYDENDGDIIINRDYEFPVAICFKSDLRDEIQYDPEEVRANANLIAAAPDLYAALEEVLNSTMAMREEDFRYDEGSVSDVLNLCRAVLAKARGENQ